MRSDLFSAMAMNIPPSWIHRHFDIRIVYGQGCIDRHPTVPHILLTVHDTMPTDVGPQRQGRHRARRLGWRRSAATEAASSPRNVSTLLTARLPPVARPSRRCPAHSTGRHAPRQRLDPGDPSSAQKREKKSCAESLRTTHSLYPSDFRWVTPALNLSADRNVAARPARRGPYSLIVFWHRGWPVPPVRAQRAQLGWWKFVCTVSRVDDAAHDV